MRIRLPQSQLGIRSCLLTVVIGTGLYVSAVGALHAYRWPLVKPPLEIALRRMDPLIAALEAYRQDHGHYPESLRELMPRYLASFPQFPPPLPPVRYWVVGAPGAQTCPYELVTRPTGRYIPTWPLPVMLSRTLYYRSDGRYPPRLDGHALRDRVGRWRYYAGFDIDGWMSH